VPGAAGQQLADALKVAFVDGFARGSIVAAVVVLAGAIGALIALPARGRHAASTPTAAVPKV